MRKKDDEGTRKQRKTEQAVRKASARTSSRSTRNNAEQGKSARGKSTQSRSAQQGNSTKRDTLMQHNASEEPISSQRKTSSKRTSSFKGASSRQRICNTSNTPNTPASRTRNASTRHTGASVRPTEKSTTRKRSSRGSSHGAHVRRTQPAKPRKLTAADIARRKRRRRLLIVALAILAFFIAILCTLHYVSNRIHDQEDIAVTDDTKSFAPIACNPDILDVTMKSDAPLDEATPITFTLELHNTSKAHPCYLDVGREHTEVTITSGDDAIAALSTCEDTGKKSKPLLIDRDMTTSFTLTWNRYRGKGCTPDAQVAAPGTYKALWETKGDNPLSAGTVFEIQEPPPPEPEPELEPVPDAGNSEGAAVPAG